MIVDTKKNAQGSIYLLLSRIITLACGFVIHIFLARRLGPKVYGVYGLIMSVLLWVEYTVMIGIPSTYRKVISEDEGMIDSVINSMKKIFLPYCLIILMIFFLVSPLISQVFKDNQLLLLLLIAGLDIPFYGIYYANLGILNGRREFLKQSFAMSSYALFKTIVVSIFIVIGLGIRWILVANMMASFFAILITLFFIKGLKYQKTKKEIRNLRPEIITFGIPYLLYMLTSMLLIHIDIWFVKGVLKNDVMTGFYSVSYNFSRPLFYLMTAIIMVTFPSFSKAVSEGNIQLLKKYIRQAVRFGLVILLPVAVIISSTAEEFISLLFTPEYLPASNPLKMLTLGIIAFSIFSLFLNIIAAKNKPFYSFVISLVLLPIAVALNYFFINSYGIFGAALATTMVSIIGLIVSGAYLCKEFGAIVDLNTLLRVALAAGGLFVISKYINISGYWLILEYFILSLSYLVLLLVLGEINRGDIKIIKEACCSMFRPV
ncbi:oligosaccharide flippase family protein [bacterium]|nr:oligosaccharide flippase family protein [bacterium]